MSNIVLENGIYSITQPAFSSSITSRAVLMAENELFDEVCVKEEAKKSSKDTKALTITISDSNGIGLHSKDEADCHDDQYPQRKISSARLDPTGSTSEGAASCCSKKTKKYICNTLVVISLIVVVALYSLGIVFFYTDVPENENFDYDKLRDEILDQLELCLELENAGNVATQPPENCFEYTGESCLAALQSVASNFGINASGNSIMVQRNTQAGSIDPDIIFKFFNSHPSISEECQTLGLPVFCQYFYPICNPTDGSVISITEEQCVSVTEGVCKDAVQLAADVPMFNIPSCSEFASETSSGMQTNDDSAHTGTTACNNTCHPQFDKHCGMCVPACNRFSETSEDRQLTIDIFFIVAALTCVIGGTFVILVSIVRRDVMFDFPSVLIIYMTIVMMVISILVLISYSARDDLYCTYSQLPLAYENPTFFCQFSGFVLHAGVLQIVLYWLLHLIHLFMKFIFPFAIRRFDTKKWKRIFHIIELILINLVTVIAPIYIILNSKYYPFGYPPVLCVPNATFTFYSLVLPIIVMLCLGTCIILLMFWRLQMRTEFVRRNASRISRVFRLTTAEFKVVVLLCFFLTFGIVNAIYFSLYSRNYNFVLSLALEYFSCELNGNATCENKMESCEVHRDEIQRYRYYGLANTSYFLMGLLTISNFLFAIHVKQLKGQVRRFSMKAASKFRSTLNHSRAAANHSKQSKDSN